MSNKKKTDNDWVIGLLLCFCIGFVFYGLYTSNLTQILGGLLSFTVFSIWYSGLIHSLITLKQKKEKK